MKKIFLVLITIMFSLNLNGSYLCDEEDLYKDVSNIVDFCESGLKVSFSTNKDLEEILKSINKLDLLYLDNTLYEDNVLEDKFYFEKINEDNSIKVLIGKEKNYNIEIEIIDKKNMININLLKKELNKLSKDAYNFNYFTFVKGKLANQSNYELENSLFNILDCYNIQNKSSILLENGLTGIFTVQERLKFNYSIMNYNNGTYLIMGSPIIFITY
ncbi:MAG: hypothetical protein Q4B63_05835 [Clostridium perfringens]|nr:hypothetical protein [Clostridium perfringens]